LADSFFCTMCGAAVQSDWNECRVCGADIYRSAQQNTAPEQPVYQQPVVPPPAREYQQQIPPQNYQQQAPPPVYPPPYVPPVQVVYQHKSKILAGLLGIFLGSLGIHNFYLGYNNKAVVQLILGICSCGSISGLWGLIEGIMILAGSINVDGNGQPLID